MKKYIVMALYLLLSSVIVNRAASVDSIVGVKAPKPLRRVLLIFSDEKERISIFAIVFQIFTYCTLVIFLLQTAFTLDFLELLFGGSKRIYAKMLEFQLPAFALLLLADMAVCGLKNWRRKRREPTEEIDADVYILQTGNVKPDIVAELVEGAGRMLLAGARRGENIDWSEPENIFGMKKLIHMLTEKKPHAESIEYGTATIAENDAFILRARYGTENEARKKLESFSLRQKPSNKETTLIAFKEILVVFCPMRR